MYLRRLTILNSNLTVHFIRNLKIVSVHGGYLFNLQLSIYGGWEWEVFRFGLAEDVTVKDQKPIPLSLGLTFPKIGSLITKDFFGKKVPISGHFRKTHHFFKIFGKF